MSSGSSRDLLPLSPTGTSTQDSSAPSSNDSGTAKNKRSTVGAACRACRSKKTKCNGGRPRCHACIWRSTECVYDALPGETWAEARRKRMEQLETDHSSMLEIIWFLRSQPSEQAFEFLEFLRSTEGMDLQDLTRYMTGKEESLRSAEAESQHADDDDLPIDATEDLRIVPSLYAEGENGESSMLKDFLSEALARASAVSNAPLAAQFATIETVENSVEMFVRCTNVLFYTVSDEQVAEDLDYLKKFRGGLVSEALESTSTRSRAQVAEIAGMAAIGVLYLRQSNPAPSLPAVLADYLYTISKHLLDDAIQDSPLRAMKVCALLALYNVLLHATVALAYTEMGLSLGHVHALDFTEQPHSMSYQKYVDSKRTWRTLLMFKCWLSGSLNYLPTIKTAGAPTSKTDHDMLPEEIVQQEMLKICTIKARIFHILADRRHAEATKVRTLHEELQTFHSELPAWMTLDQLLTAARNDSLRRIIFYVHLFYLSAMMLLHRKLLSRLVSVEGRPSMKLTNGFEQIRLAIADGLLAAKTAARVFNLLLEDKTVVKICWLCIFTAYTSGILILYEIAQKTLNNYHPSTWADDVPLIASCLDVLEYCSNMDSVAGQFKRCLLVYKDIILVEQPGSKKGTGKLSEDGRDKDAPIDCLFKLVPGKSDLHAAARDLVRLIHRPFGGNDSASMLEGDAREHGVQSTLVGWMESAMGPHLEWEWDIQTPTKTKSRNESRLQELLSLLEYGKSLELHPEWPVRNSPSP